MILINFSRNSTEILPLRMLSGGFLLVHFDVGTKISRSLTLDTFYSSSSQVEILNIVFILQIEKFDNLLVIFSLFLMKISMINTEKYFKLNYMMFYEWKITGFYQIQMERTMTIIDQLICYLQIGQSAFLFNHSSMHSEWKICKHGSLLTNSALRIELRQTVHWSSAPGLLEYLYLGSFYIYSSSSPCCSSSSYWESKLESESSFLSI